MDSVKRSKLRFLSLLSVKILLKVWYKWKTTVRFLEKPKIPYQTFRINKNYNEKNLSNTSTKIPNSVLFGIGAGNKLNIVTKLSAEKKQKRINSSSESIFEEIKASLKNKAENSRFIPSPNKELSDCPTEIFGVGLRTRHKRANTDYSNLKSSIYSEKT